MRKTRLFLRFVSILAAVFGPILFNSIPTLAQVRPLEERSNSGLVYHGKLVKPNGKVVEGSLTAQVKILSPEPSKCVLWAETQSVTLKNGAFAMELGYDSNRVSSGAGSSGSGAASFREVFLNHPTLNIVSSECESGTSYTPSGTTDDRLLSVTFLDGANPITVEDIPIKAVPYAQQANEVGGYGASHLIKISGTGSSVEFSPDEVQSLKDLLGGSLNWDMGSSRLTNVADPVASTDATNKQWVIDYVTNNGGGGAMTGPQIITALGYTPVSSTSSSQVQSALGYTPVNRAGDTMTGALDVSSSGQFAGLLTASGGLAGGATAAGDLTLISTSNATKGKIRFGASYYDEATNRFMLGLSTASARQVGDRTSRVQMEGGTNNNSSISLVTNGTSVNSNPALVLGRSNGAAAGDVTAVPAGHSLGNISFVGADGTTMNSIAARIKADSDGTVSTGVVPGRLTLSTASSAGVLTERLRVNSSGNVGIGTISPSEMLEVAGNIKGTQLCIGADCRSVWPSSGEANTTSNIGTAGVGVFKQKTGVNFELKKINSGGAPITVTDDTGNNELDIGITQANTSTPGYLSSGDWNSFNNKLSSALPSGQVWVGNVSNIAAPIWFGVDDLKTAAGLAQFTTPCNSAAKTLNWNAITDSFTCTDIAIADSAVTFASKAQNSVFAGPSGASGAPSFRALVESDIPTLSWSKITGEPTTASGYGITDAVINGGQSGAVTLGSSDANNLTLNTSGSARMTVTSTGNVGIGTISPASKLQVYQTAGTGLQFVAGFQTDDGDGNSVGIGFLNEWTGSWYKAGIVHERTGNWGVGNLHFINSDLGDSSTVDLTKSRLMISPIGNVGIGTTSPNSTAALDVSSTTKGFLPPRMTTAQRQGIASPATGLMVYDTDENSMYNYSGTEWVKLGGAAALFSVDRNNVDQSIPDSTWTLMNWTTESYDTASAFNLATDRFQPTSAGYYYFTASAYFAVFPVNSISYLCLAKNGANVICDFEVVRGSASSTTVKSSGAIYLNGTTDYVSVNVNQSSGGSFPVDGSVAWTHFSGFSLNAGSLSGGGAADNLGTHVATQNLVLGGNYLSGDGDAEGIRIDSSGKVGIGTTSPTSTLVVNGASRNQASISNGSATIDFSTGNLQYTTSNCGTFALHNLKDGGAYTFAVQGTTSALCAFNAYSDAGSTSLTVKLPTDHAATTTGKHTIYTFMVMGGFVYVAWNPGY